MIPRDKRDLDQITKPVFVVILIEALLTTYEAIQFKISRNTSIGNQESLLCAEGNIPSIRFIGNAIAKLNAEKIVSSSSVKETVTVRDDR